MFCEHPKLLLVKDHPVDITRFASPHLMPPHGKNSLGRRELSKVIFEDLVAGSSSTTLLPKESMR